MNYENSMASEMASLRPLYQFERLEGTEYTTLVCACGERYTWKALESDLIVVADAVHAWEAEHRPHLQAALQRRIDETAESCAQAAIDAGGRAPWGDGTLLAGDCQALIDVVGRDPTPDEIGRFYDAFRKALEDKTQQLIADLAVECAQAEVERGGIAPWGAGVLLREGSYKRLRTELGRDPSTAEIERFELGFRAMFDAHANKPATAVQAVDASLRSGGTISILYDAREAAELESWAEKSSGLDSGARVYSGVRVSDLWAVHMLAEDETVRFERELEEVQAAFPEASSARVPLEFGSASTMGDAVDRVSVDAIGLGEWYAVRRGAGWIAVRDGRNDYWYAQLPETERHSGIQMTFGPTLEGLSTPVYKTALEALAVLVPTTEPTLQWVVPLDVSDVDPAMLVSSEVEHG